ncbi:MFS transporter [Streptomyces sp. URMC 125]|uniref:MFS transporter n=1 Tax=Streptomyces sp. URMC 125 TaxID=3423419 RepID=UPI003F52BAB0
MPAAVRDAVPLRAHRRAVIVTVVGNFVEYFDWLAYGLFAQLFAAQFFPSSNPVTSLLGAFAVFGTGMLCRPLGGVLFGRLADRRGRKPALMWSIALMATGSALIGIAPTYEQIGLAAPLILLLARLAQGLSSGGEWPAAATYLMELAPEHRKGLYGSLFSLTAAAGAFAASLLGGGLNAWLGPEAMTAWGWRIPFLVGAALGVFLLVARHRMTETEVFEREVRTRAARGSLRRVLGVHRSRVAVTVLLVAGMTTVSGTWSTVVPSMGHRLAEPGVMFWVVVCATGTVIALQVPLGLLADRVGAMRFLVVSSIGFAAVGSYAYLGVTGEFASLYLTYGCGVLYLGCTTTVMPKVLASVFPPQVRALGIGLPHSTATAVLGGVAPWLATYLGARGASGWFVGGVMAAVLLVWPALAMARRLQDPPAEGAGEGSAGDPADRPADRPAGAVAAGVK